MLKFLYTLLFLFSLNLYSKETKVSVDSYNAAFTFTPGNILVGRLKTTLGYVDNFLYSDLDQLSTSTLEVEPSIFIQTQMDRNLLQLLASTTIYKFSEFSEDDHENYDLTAKYHFKPTVNQRFSITAHYEQLYEERGTGLSQGEGDSITRGDEKKINFYNLGYYFGHENSVARIWLLAGRRSFEYTTRQELTKGLDHSGDYIEVGADYLYSGKSYFTGKIDYEKLSYKFNPNNSRIETAALFGFKWYSSVLLKSEFLFGLSELEFYESNVENKDTFRWDVDLIWQPTELYNVEFTSSRSIEDASQFSSEYKIVDNYTLAIEYNFTDNVDIVFDMARKNQQVLLNNEVNNENYNLLSMRTVYQVNKSLLVFVNYEYKQLQSTYSSDDFNRNNVSIGLNIKI